MQVIGTGPQVTENGTFQDTEELIRNSAKGSGGAQSALEFLVMNTMLQKGAEQQAALRTSSQQSLGKALHVNIRV